MQTRVFGKTGLHVSPLGFGGAPLGYLETPQEQVADLLNAYLDCGGNVIDTAAAYADSEEAIGRTIADRREDFILISKCGRELSDVQGREWSPGLIEETIVRSLRRLRTDHLDVALLHSCPLDVLNKGDAMDALDKARAAGKARFIGYSGDNESAVHAAGMNNVSVLETSANICDQRNMDNVLEAARKANLGVIAKRPIANAAWKQRDRQPGMYADYAAEYSRRFSEMGLTLDDLGIEGEAESAWPAVALRFTAFQEGVHTAIVGTTNKEHLAANLAAVDEGPLDDDVVQRIRTAFAEAQARNGAPWQGQT